MDTLSTSAIQTALQRGGYRTRWYLKANVTVVPANHRGKRMPSKGVSLRRIPDDLPAAGAAVLRLHASAYMTDAEIDSLRKAYTRDVDFQKEINIEYEALEGELMWPEYRPELVDCDPFDVSNPDQWTIWMACDPHMRTPHAFIWKAWNREGDSVVCGELWDDKLWPVSQYAEVIKWIESDSELKPKGWEWASGKPLRVHMRFMDTHGTAANSDEGINFFSAYRNHGIVFYSAFKSQQAIAAARDAIGKSMLPVDIIDPVTGTVRQVPQSRIFRCCRELRKQYSTIRYPQGDAERASHEKPITYHKHHSDCTIYIQTGRPSFVAPVDPALQNTFVPIYSNLGGA